MYKRKTWHKRCLADLLMLWQYKYMTSNIYSSGSCCPFVSDLVSHILFYVIKLLIFWEIRNVKDKYFRNASLCQKTGMSTDLKYVLQQIQRSCLYCICKVNRKERTFSYSTLPIPYIYRYKRQRERIDFGKDILMHILGSMFWPTD